MTRPDDPLRQLREQLLDPTTNWPSAPPSHGLPRRAAVLALISSGTDPDITFTERAHSLRNHPGQIAFPGGRSEPEDAGPLATALREAHEEIGLERAGVHAEGLMSSVPVPVSSFTVVPVIATWPGDHELTAVDAGEVASVHRWRISELADPARRVSFRHPMGHVGPAWQFDDLFLWGFTAYLVDHILRIAGWEQPWDATRMVDVPRRFRSDRPQVDH